jgi:hypothetical protein
MRRPKGAALEFLSFVGYDAIYLLHPFMSRELIATRCFLNATRPLTLSPDTPFTKTFGSETFIERLMERFVTDLSGLQKVPAVD